MKRGSVEFCWAQGKEGPEPSKKAKVDYAGNSREEDFRALLEMGFDPLCCVRFVIS